MRANPTAIGLFLIGAVCLTVGGAALLAGTSLFTRHTTFISYFRESVNGLEDGAPVKFQGAPVGKVTRMLIQIDDRNKTFQVPVEYEINLKLLRTQLRTFVNLRDEGELARQIANGLRAQLQMQSMVTGQLYVELSYRQDAPAPTFETGLTPFPEIPTTPSLMAALGTDAGSIVADVVKVLFKVNELLGAIDMKGINSAVVASARSVQSLAEAPELRVTMRSLPAVTSQLVRTLARVDTLAERTNAAVGPMSTDLKAATRELSATLQSLRQTVDETHGIMSTDSDLGNGLQTALASIKDATSALRLLVSSLEQNPDMLLRGKKPPRKN